ncbi:PaaI family thioesterase [Metapseudomonas furukawaii]|uniref:PaaI family thioesterase n=1 Tax=Metapseudomonas furukawaii TaxID=1149133 RepID=UPI0040465B16
MQPPQETQDYPPAGFQPMQSAGFVGHCRLYHHPELGLLGARIRPEYLNKLEIAHGGFLATLADTALGLAVFRACGSSRPFATVTLTMDYLSPALPGRWIEAHAHVHRIGRSLSHASLELKDGHRVIAHGKAIFTALHPN